MTKSIFSLLDLLHDNLLSWCQTVLVQIRTDIGPDLGPNCLHRLSERENGKIFIFTPYLKPWKNGLCGISRCY